MGNSQLTTAAKATKLTPAEIAADLAAHLANDALKASVKAAEHANKLASDARVAAEAASIDRAKKDKINSRQREKRLLKQLAVAKADPYAAKKMAQQQHKQILKHRNNKADVDRANRARQSEEASRRARDARLNQARLFKVFV
jgi:hypothetical protein